MGNPRKTTYGTKVYEQSAAQWAADTRIFDVNVILVPTDGADRGKHKMANGIDTYAGLPFIEDGGSGGGAGVYLNGVAQSGIYSRTVSTVNGQITIDWTVAQGSAPALASCKVISMVTDEDDPYVSFRLVGPTVNNMVIGLFNLQDGQDITGSGTAVTVTVVGIQA